MKLHVREERAFAFRARTVVFTFSENRRGSFSDLLFFSFGLQQRGKLFGTLAVVGGVAAVVVGDAGLRIDEAERRLCDLGRRGQPCSQRVIGVSCSGSCARLPKAFGTLGGLILTYAESCTRTCELAVAVCPLRRARCRDRSRSPLVAHNAPRNGDLHMCTV